jgi:hypothetical protein
MNEGNLSAGSCEAMIIDLRFEEAKHPARLDSF